MLDDWTSLNLILMSVIVIAIVFVIGWCGIHLTEGKTCLSSANHTLQLLCGRGPDLTHPVFSPVFYVIAWLATILVSGVLVAELIKRAISPFHRASRSSGTP